MRKLDKCYNCGLGRKRWKEEKYQQIALAMLVNWDINGDICPDCGETLDVERLKARFKNPFTKRAIENFYKDGVKEGPFI